MKFKSAIEMTYSLLFLGSVFYISKSIFEGFESDSDKLEKNFIIACMLLILFAQMTRIYHVLHELDNGSNDPDHFINLVEGGWVVYERILRIFLALIVILAVKFQSQDVVSSIGYQSVFRISEWIHLLSQYLSQYLPRIFGEKPILYSKHSFLLAYYSLMMFIIYWVFCIWDLFVYFSAKVVLGKPSCENIKKQARSLVLYLNPKKLSESTLQESGVKYEKKLDKIVEENTFSYLFSEKFYERLVGAFFFLSTIFFIFTNGSDIFLFLSGGLTFAFMYYNKDLGGSILRWPFELVLSVFKIK